MWPQYEPTHKILVLITLSSNVSSDKPAKMSFMNMFEK